MAARRSETTSRKVASKAGKALKDPRASKREKSLAGSALTQREPKPISDSVYRQQLERVERAFATLFEAIAALRDRIAGKVRKAPHRAR